MLNSSITLISKTLYRFFTILYISIIHSYVIILGLLDLNKINCKQKTYLSCIRATKKQISLARFLKCSLQGTHLFLPVYIRFCFVAVCILYRLAQFYEMLIIVIYLARLLTPRILAQITDPIPTGDTHMIACTIFIIT